MASCGKFELTIILAAMQILALVLGQDSGEAVAEVDHALLCPPRSHDVFHKPCMDHCAKAYRNHDSGACGQCIDYAERINFVEKKCMCFLGLRCFPAVPFNQ